MDAGDVTVRARERDRGGWAVGGAMEREPGARPLHAAARGAARTLRAGEAHAELLPARGPRPPGSAVCGGDGAPRTSGTAPGGQRAAPS